MSDISPRWIRITKEPTSNLDMLLNDLVEDSSYQFRVVAVNKAGESEPSKPSSPVKVQDPWRE